MIGSPHRPGSAPVPIILLKIPRLKQLGRLNTFFWKYRWRFLLGILFIILSNYFRILTPQITGFVIDSVQLELLKQKQSEQFVPTQNSFHLKQQRYDVLVKSIIAGIESRPWSVWDRVLWCGITLIVLAFLGGFFMFLMRQTIIVMSRHIEYDQKNQIFAHYLKLDKIGRAHV